MKSEEGLMIEIENLEKESKKSLHFYGTLRHLLDDAFCSGNAYMLDKKKVVSLSLEGEGYFDNRESLLSLPEALKQFKDLRFLSISRYSNLKNFENLVYLKNLAGLYLSDIDLYELPFVLSKLPKLKEIYLSGIGNKVDLSNIQ